MTFYATGLVPVGHINGSSWNGKGRTYYIRSADTNAYYIGDAVLSTAFGDANGVPGCVKATAGTETLRGVIIGVFPVNPTVTTLVGTALNLENTYIPATKARDYYVEVADAPDTIFEITDDGLTTAKLVSTSCNKNFSLTIAAPSSPVQQSATVILSSSIDTTSSLNMKLLGLAQYAGNSFVSGGSGYRWQCVINLHELSAAGVAGV